MDEKKKGFFKKYWGYIVSFIVGIGSALLYFFGISRKSRSSDGETRRELVNLTSGISSATEQVGDIRGEVRETRTTNQQQRETIREGRNANAGIVQQSEEVGKSISDIRKLIEEERKRIEKSENPH